MMIRLARSLAGPALATLLSACSLLPEAEPVRFYQLPAYSQAGPGSVTHAWSLRVATPQANPMLDSVRILVVPEGERISSYRNARWSARAPVLLRDRLIDAFQADGRLKTVSGDSSLLHADVELVSDLRSFESEYRDGRPEIRLRLDARLARRGHVIASRRFDISERCEDSSVEAVVRAFGRASDTLGGQVVNWTLAQEVPRS